jgi:hypothetical protein
MRTRTAVLDLEISGKFTELNDIGDFGSALVLFRLHGRPLGWGAASVTDGRLDRGALVRQLLEQHAWSCALPLAERAVYSGIPPKSLDVHALLQAPPSSISGGPLVTVAVCNRTLAAQLVPCLDSLLALDYAPLDLVVIDASDDRANVEALLKDTYPTIRYCSSPSASASSRRAVSECRGDVLALTQGDAVVDRRWVSRLVAVFLADPEVMTVSGFTLPRSIERPMRASLPAGAPFCREWIRVDEESARGGGSLQQALERPTANAAFWLPGHSVSGPYTHVFEPSAIVRAASSASTAHARNRRAPIAPAPRTIDLANGLLPIADATDAHDLALSVMWAGAAVGTAQIVHQGAIVSPMWLADAIAHQLTVEVLDARLGLGEHVCRALVTADLARHIIGRIGLDARSAPTSAKRSAAAA